jgi:7TM diverse intracellular signalling/7TMR-DISM extracellular 2
MNVFRLVLALIACFFFHGNTYALQGSGVEQAEALGDVANKSVEFQIVSLGNWPVAINAAQIVDASRQTQIKFDPNAMHYASWDTPLWLRIRVSASAPRTSESWVLNFNKPLIEQIEVYTQSAEGFWQKQTAGLFTAHSKWPLQSLTPQFVIPAKLNGNRDVLVRVLHHFPTHFNLTLQTSEAAAANRQNQFLLAGLLLGLMGLMCAASSVMAVIYRNISYIWYALYVGVSFFACASYVGMANYWLWPNSPWWATNASATLTMVTMMAQTQFCRSMFSAKGVGRLWERQGLNVILLLSGLLTLFSVYTDSIAACHSCWGSCYDHVGACFGGAQTKQQNRKIMVFCLPTPYAGTGPFHHRQFRLVSLRLDALLRAAICACF